MTKQIIAFAILWTRIQRDVTDGHYPSLLNDAARYCITVQYACL